LYFFFSVLYRPSLLVLKPVFSSNKRKGGEMSKLSWVVVCVLVVFNSAVIVASLTEDERGARCDPWSCQGRSFVIRECFHWDNDPNGAPCSKKECLFTGITHYFCNSGEHNWCDLVEDPQAQFVIQWRRKADNCPSAPFVNWTEYTNWVLTPDGVVPLNPCDGIRNYRTACETTSCNGESLESRTIPMNVVCREYIAK